MDSKHGKIEGHLFVSKLQIIEPNFVLAGLKVTCVVYIFKAA
jgi:hypothetical protein